MSYLPFNLTRIQKSFLLVVVAHFLVALPLSAQDLDSVTISGRVMDQNGAMIPGATVTTIQVKTARARTSSADDVGSYRLIQLEPGVYTLRVSANGFAADERIQLTVVAGQNIQLDVVLLPQGVVVDPVMVTAVHVPAIDITRTVVGGTVNAQQVEALPVFSRSPRI